MREGHMTEGHMTEGQTFYCGPFIVLLCAGIGSLVRVAHAQVPLVGSLEG